MSAPATPGSGPLTDVTCVRGETFVISAASGDVLPGGAHGLYLRDTRVLDHLEVHVNGAPPSPLTGVSFRAADASFHGQVPLEHAGPDPVLVVARRRSVDGVLHEEIEVTNWSHGPLDVEVVLRLGTDLAYIFDVRHRRTLDRVPAEPRPNGVVFCGEDGIAEARVVLDPPPDEHRDDGVAVRRRIGPRDSFRWCCKISATDVYGTVAPVGACADVGATLTMPVGEPVATAPTVSCSDRRMERLLERSRHDLDALQLRDPDATEDRFLAAGSPWYLTLFGRDSLWSAFMATPFDVGLATSTLRVLARRQGRREDAETEEAPGKILHEVRRGSLTHRGDLPPNYYGTIDATPLFVVLAHEAWSWGAPTEEIAELLPAVEAALGWIEVDGDPDGDGFLEYAKGSDRGLDNQGWKDSHDGIQFADGRIAAPPIALAEVQGYAYDALVRGATLLEAFGRPDVNRWRDRAATLAEGFRARFWVDDEQGSYPAVALDGAKQQVTGPASNMGHLLASGLFGETGASAIAAQLTHPRLASGWGLRTMATTAAGFNPLGYHTGTVWPHDTAIAIWGLASTGHRDAAVQLLHELLDAAPTYRYRLPELFGGVARSQTPVPVPYSAACRPQAWAAAGSWLLLRACLGLRAHLPDDLLEVDPLWPPPFSHLEVRDLPVAGRGVSIEVDARRGVRVSVDGAPLRLRVHDPTAGWSGR